MSAGEIVCVELWSRYGSGQLDYCLIVTLRFEAFLPYDSGRQQSPLLPSILADWCVPDVFLPAKFDQFLICRVEASDRSLASFIQNPGDILSTLSLPT